MNKSKTEKKSKPKIYLFHELSSYLPLLEGEEFDALVEDIKEFGQIEPAILYEGKILDGRNRYRACKRLGIELRAREWKPSKNTGMTPLQFVISENIMRRHLNTAQKAEIGLLLLEEEERLAKERSIKISKAKADILNVEGKQDFQKISDKSQKELLTQEIKKIQDEMGSGASAEIVGKKVKVGHSTLYQAKKIKQVAEKDKSIAVEWEKAKKGEQGVNTVYEIVKSREEVANLPEEYRGEVETKIEKEKIKPTETRVFINKIKEMPSDVRSEILKPDSELTLKEAIEISEFPEPDQRQIMIKQLKQTKKAQENIIKKKKEMANNIEEQPIVVEDLDEKFLKIWTDIEKNIKIKMRKDFLQPYGKRTKQRCYAIVKKIINFLISEFSEEVDVIGT